MIRRPALACALIPLLAFGGRAAAHTGGSTGYVAVAVEGATVRYTLTLWPATLPSAIAAASDSGLEAAKSSDLPAPYRSSRWRT